MTEGQKADFLHDGKLYASAIDSQSRLSQIGTVGIDHEKHERHEMEIWRKYRDVWCSHSMRKSALKLIPGRKYSFRVFGVFRGDLRLHRSGCENPGLRASTTKTLRRVDSMTRSKLAGGKRVIEHELARAFWEQEFHLLRIDPLRWLNQLFELFHNRSDEFFRIAVALWDVT